jgi:phage terminase small subunit
MTRPTTLEPPSHLSESSRAIWDRYVPSVVKLPGPQSMLSAALQARDRAEEARREVERDGMLLVSKRSTLARVHPAVRIEKESLALFTKIMQQLHLNWDRDR